MDCDTIWLWHFVARCGISELGTVSRAAFMAVSSSMLRRLIFIAPPMSLLSSSFIGVCKNQIACPRAFGVLNRLCRTGLATCSWGGSCCSPQTLAWCVLGFVSPVTRFFLAAGACTLHALSGFFASTVWLKSGGVSSNSWIIRLVRDLRRGDSLNINCSRGRDTLPIIHWHAELASDGLHPRWFQSSPTTSNII